MTGYQSDKQEIANLILEAEGTIKIFQMIFRFLYLISPSFKCLKNFTRLKPLTQPSFNPNLTLTQPYPAARATSSGGDRAAHQPGNSSKFNELKMLVYSTV